MKKVFIDDLGLELSSLIFVGALSAYITASSIIAYRKGWKNVNEVLTAGSIPLLVISLFIVILSLYDEFTWRLPGSYNIFFGDAYLMLGLTLLAISLSIQFKQKLQYSGFMALLSGLMAIYYGALGYQDKLTSEPLAAFGLYLIFGISGILAFPATLIYDALPRKEKVSGIEIALLILFVLSLIGASIMAVIIGGGAIQSHLAHAP